MKYKKSNWELLGKIWRIWWFYDFIFQLNFSCFFFIYLILFSVLFCVTCTHFCVILRGVCAFVMNNPSVSLISPQSSLTTFAENLQEMINYHTVRESGSENTTALLFMTSSFLPPPPHHFRNAKLECAEMRILTPGEMTPSLFDTFHCWTCQVMSLLFLEDNFNLQTDSSLFSPKTDRRRKRFMLMPATAPLVATLHILQLYMSKRQIELAFVCAGYVLCLFLFL